MLPGMQTLTIGPEHGSLTLHTGVEGRAAKAGHALTLRLTDWSAAATLEGPELAGLTLRTALISLEVVSGEGGVKPLSDKDKRSIKASTLETLTADRHPEVSFTSSSVTARGDGYEAQGELVLAGVAAPLVVGLSVERSGGTARVEALVPVVQTQFGVKPYTGLMGGLRVRDRVDVRLSVTVPDPA